MLEDVGDNTTMTETIGDRLITEEACRHRLESFRTEIVRSFYSDAAMHEAKKKQCEPGSFRYEYHEMKQSFALLAAKHIEHWRLDWEKWENS